MADQLHPHTYRDLVARALAEDIGFGDVTTEALVPPQATARGSLVARQECVVAGLDIAREVFAQVDRSIAFDAVRHDGDRCESGAAMAMVQGPTAGLLTAERTALNFLQHLSGIATLTRAFVDAAAGHLTVLDTRKTIPTLRQLAKYAVSCGGGVNHRRGLFDAVLIKDNHVHLTGGVAEAVRRVRSRVADTSIEVEAQDLDDVDQAIEAGADVIMLDNLSDELMKEAVRRIAGRARVEVSGGITLARIPALVAIGVNSVSVGALTHSAPAVDISLELSP